MVKLANRAKMTTSTVGTGTITLGSASAGFQTFAAAGVADGETVRYVIEDGNDWEIGSGIYTASGTTLTRSVLESSNSDAAISLTGGATVYVTAVAEDIPAAYKGSLTKTFVSGETATITLTESAAPAPIVAVTKEVSQVGQTNSDWDVAADGSNFDIEDFATSVNVTLDIDEKTLTLASGNWSSSDVGRTFVNGDVKVLIGSVTTNVAKYSDVEGEFSASGTINSGDWSLYGLDFTSSGVTISNGTFVEDTVVQRSAFTHGLGMNGWNEYPNGTEDEVLGIYIVTGGEYMIITDRSAGTIDKYSLPTPYSVEGATLDSTSGTGIVHAGYLTFKPDGTELYCYYGSNIRQYSLSTAWDVTTISFTGISPSAVTANYRGITFLPDGSGYYLVYNSGSTTQRHYFYTLSTPWDITTSSYSTNYTLATGFTGVHAGLFFNSDGTKAFVPQLSKNAIFGFDLPTAYSLSGATIDNNTDGTPLANNSPGDVFYLSQDGKNIYSGSFNYGIKHYQLAIPYGFTQGSSTNYLPIETGSYEGNNLSFWAPVMSADGTKIFYNQYNSDLIYTKELSSAYDITTALSSVSSYDLNTALSGVQAPRTIRFSSDGTKMFTHGTNSAYEFALSTAWDVSTASHNYTLTLSGQTNCFGFDFSDDGTKMYTVGFTVDATHYYELGTAWDLSTAVYTDFFDYSSLTLAASGCKITNNGYAFHIYDYNPDKIHSFELTTPYDISTAVLAQVVTSDDFLYHVPYYNMEFSSDGRKLIGIDVNTREFFQIHLTEPFNPIPFGSVVKAPVGAAGTRWGMLLNDDGTKLYVTTYTADQIEEYALSTPYDHTTMSLTTTHNIANASMNAAATLMWGPNGTSLFVGDTNNYLHEYSLSTAYDVSTFTYVSSKTNPYGTYHGRFNDDGTKYFSVNLGGYQFYELALSTAYDISTYTLTSTQSGLGHGTTMDFRAFEFVNDGRTVLFSDDLSNDLKISFLETAYDITSGKATSFIQWEDLMGEARYFYDFHVADNGKYLFALNTGREVLRFPLQRIIRAANDRAAINKNYAAITKSTSVIDTTYWTDVNSMTVTDTSNGQSAFYAVSIDGETYKVIHDTNGERSIVRNNGGTWEYNSNTTYASETWSSAAINSLYGALDEAVGVTQNQMDKSQLNAVTDPNHYTLGNSFSLAIILGTSTNAAVPVSDGATINYDANAINQGAILGTDYDYDFPANDKVRITSNAAQNLKIKVN